MIVYTAITNGDGMLRDPLIDDEANGVAFHAFVDRPLDSRVWQTAPVGRSLPDLPSGDLYQKIMSHIFFPSADISLWMDPHVQLRAEPADLARRFLRGADLAVFSHPERCCVYQEIAYLLRMGCSDREAILRQVFRYTRESYPANNGLAECSVILRRNNQKVKEFNELWWQELQSDTGREDLSFPYVVWKTGIKINYFPRTIRKSPFFFWRNSSANGDAEWPQQPSQPAEG